MPAISPVRSLLKSCQVLRSQTWRDSEAPVTTTSLCRPACSMSAAGSCTRPAESSSVSKRVRGEPEAHAAGVGGHRVQPLQRALDDGVVRVGDPEVDVALEALREDDPSAELGAELRRDREAVLCIERVVE